MQRALAIDGVEWTAADFTFDQNGRINGTLQRTQVWAGSSGVWTGGLVAAASGLNISITGPFQFQALGEMGVIASPANILLPANSTLFIVGQYLETADTPATYYAAGSPPNLHQNPTPAIVFRTSGGGGAAVEANKEVNLATVVTGAATITTVTDTRKLLPSVDGNGNILLGSGATIDGMDPSVHQTLIGSTSVAAHTKLGAPGGATPYGTLSGAWTKDEFIDVASAFGAGKILDDSDFASPPGSSQPFAATGLLYLETFVPTRYGELAVDGYGPHFCTRYTLNITATGIFTVQMYATYWNNTIRVKGNGTSLYSNGSSSGGNAVSITFSTVVGANTIQVYHANCDGLDLNLGFVCSVLQDSRVIFTG